MTINRIFLFAVPLVALFMGACNGNSDESDDRGDRERCDDFCDTLLDCSVAFTKGDCTDACVNDARDARASCTESFEDLADCTDDEGKSCDAVTDWCEIEADDFIDDCEVDFADTLEVIAGPGPTCGNTCVYAYDGFCDEPNICPTGTDGYDCGC
jgi:hypothetical protein